MELFRLDERICLNEDDCASSSSSYLSLISCRSSYSEEDDNSFLWLSMFSKLASFPSLYFSYNSACSSSSYYDREIACS